MAVTQLVYPFNSGWTLGCFQFEVIINKAAIHSHLQIIL